jgi:hypothetical protein
LLKPFHVRFKTDFVRDIYFSDGCIVLKVQGDGEDLKKEKVRLIKDILMHEREKGLKVDLRA